jgi:L-alanine-DL-glutamate epimerase-like enolase superfamily enzyme
VDITITPFTVHKRVALTISRGTSTHNTNLWVRIFADGIEGWGEATAFSVTRQGGLTATTMQTELEQIAPLLRPYHPLQRQAIAAEIASLSSATRAALDTALHDWLGKRAGLPLWQLWGLDPDRTVPTSVTVGISDPAMAQARVRQWQDQLGARHFKIKLGSPLGIEADRAMFEAVQATAPDGEFSVDANGGWGLEDAITMADWLADRGVRHLEQPLSVEAEGDFAALYARSPLPIFADESCFTALDIPRLAPVVHGINIKLMKAGGLSEVLRMIHAAQSHNLQIMYGCYADSSLSNAALNQLAPYAHYIDLDSHLNLRDDPFCGMTYAEGRLQPATAPGLGVERVSPESVD